MIFRRTLSVRPSYDGRRGGGDRDNDDDRTHGQTETRNEITHAIIYLKYNYVYDRYYQ